MIFFKKVRGTVMNQGRKTTRGIILLVTTIGSLLLSQNGLAAGTDAGVTISNQAQVDYEVATIAQQPILSDPAGNSTPGLASGANSTDFVVDNRIDFTIVEFGTAGATPVNPGQGDAITTFQLTNTGNATQDYALTAGNLATSTVVNSNTDSADMSNIRVYADTDGSGDYTPGVDEIFVDELAEDASILVFVVADTGTSLVDTDVANVFVAATTHDAGAVGLGVLTADDSGSGDSAGIDVVFADDGAGSVGDGIEVAQDGYIVSSAGLIITKISEVIEDPFNGTTDPKAIPGATVEYTITVQNTGAVDAEAVRITDVLNANLTLLLAQYSGEDVQIDVGAGTSITTCTLDSADADGDGCGTSGSTLTIDPTAGLTVGITATTNPAVIKFQATIN
jgi:uncharacterized repeat protein (TIGR01451 family)